MKKKSVAALVLVLIITTLAFGCSQAAASTSVQKPASPSPVQNAVPAVVTPSPSVKDTKPPDTIPTSSPSVARTENEITKISDILGNPKTYGGKIVTVKGKITSECPSGCWFTLQEGNAVIYIDLAPNNLVIPQKKGATATVTGEIIREGNDIYMVGSKVDF
jgi:hypothetical protein